MSLLGNFRLRCTIPRSAIQVRTFASTPIMSRHIVEGITHDHRELEEFYNNILRAKDNDTKVRWQNQFVWELARHSIAEEIVVYPAFEKYIENGKAMADDDRSQHNEVKVLLKRFQDLDPDNSDFEPTIKELMKKLSTHIAEEEKSDLPKLEAAISKEHAEEMGDEFQRTKMFVPSRSHPSAPDKPPFETVVGLLTTPIDRLGDMLRKFPKEQ